MEKKFKIVRWTEIEKTKTILFFLQKEKVKKKSFFTPIDLQFE